MYLSRLDELTRARPYDQRQSDWSVQARREFVTCLRAFAVDKRASYFKSFTWIEQQGKDCRIRAQWGDYRNYWGGFMPKPRLSTSQSDRIQRGVSVIVLRDC